MRGRRRGGQGIRAIGPGEDGFETPGADEGFGFGAGGHFGERIDGSTCDSNLAGGGVSARQLHQSGKNLKIAKHCCDNWDSNPDLEHGKLEFYP